MSRHDTALETARRIRANQAEAGYEAELRRAIDSTPIPIRPVQMARPIPSAFSTRALSGAIAIAQGMLLGAAIIGLAALIWWILGGRA